MNVLKIMSDEHTGRMMQFIDKSILKTPNLDRLAAESTVFTSCYSPCPVCAPARAATFTGRYVNRLGAWDNAIPYDGSVEGISHRLKAHNKKCVYMGKTHFHHDADYEFEEEYEIGLMRAPDLGGFFRDEKVGAVESELRYQRIGIRKTPAKDDDLLEHTLEWLDKHGQEQDWMFYVGFSYPHFPFYVEQEHWDHFASIITEVPDRLKPPFTSLNEQLEWLRAYFKCDIVDEETVRKLLIGYHCAIQELDIRIGKILDKVDEIGIKDSTAIIYTSDHGEQLGFHGMWWKCTMFEESANIPLIIRIPGKEPKMLNHPVNLVDIFPTICDILEIPKPTDIDGASLMPLIDGEPDKFPKDFTFSEYNCHGMPNGMYMIRWKEYKYVYFCYNRAQLFDLNNDPYEDNSLIGDGYISPEVGEVVSECHKRLLSVCDPYEVDARAKRDQRAVKEDMQLTSYELRKGAYVPFPKPVV